MGVSDVAFEDAILALREHWTDVIARLDDRSRDDLVRTLGELDGPDRPTAMTLTATLLVEKLPREHPVRRALVSGSMFAPASLDWAEVLRDFQELSAAGLPSLAAPASAAEAVTVVDEVTARLLRQPALSEAELRELGLDPGDTGLIRLRRADGGYQWPAFQFTSARSLPVPAVVRKINELLGGSRDPVGTADWWLSRNGWLGDRPYRVLGRIPDDLLVEAARAVTAEA
jgi:hypothetical protein